MGVTVGTVFGLMPVFNAFRTASSRSLVYFALSWMLRLPILMLKAVNGDPAFLKCSTSILVPYGPMKEYSFSCPDSHIFSSYSVP